MASTYLTRTFNTPTNRKIWTWSAWVKRQNQVSNYENALFGAYYDTNNRSVLRFYAHQLNFQDTANSVEIKTNRLFRDTSAWYHIVARVDTTQSTASDRVRLYVNGEQETSFATAAYPAQNDNMQFNGADPHYINGRNSSGSVDSIADMSYSHIHFADGQSLAPTVFGETDATTGEWKINTSPSFTLGTNGFTILKDGNTYTDQSSNSNNWSLGAGTLTKTEDCPSNVFCTINPLNSYWAAGTFTYGNNAVVLPNKSGAWNTGTLGMTSGKYYWEIKCTGSSNGAELQLGIADKSPKGNTGSGVAGTAFGINSNGEYGIYAYNGAFIGNGVANPYTSWGSATTNGIAMIAVDLDNNKFYGGVNGTWFASGNPATGANGKTIQAVADTVDGCYYPAVGTFQGYDGKVECNFGNGYFADNAVSSAGSNASNNGIFEYDVPTGFTALSTKGLNL